MCGLMHVYIHETYMCMPNQPLHVNLKLMESYLLRVKCSGNRNEIIETCIPL